MRITLSGSTRAARALRALACVTLAVLLGILGWRGLSLANELVEGQDYGVVSTMGDPAVSVTLPATAHLTLTAAEGYSGEDPLYFAFAQAQGEVANISAASTEAQKHDTTVRVTLNQGAFEKTAVSSWFEGTPGEATAEKSGEVEGAAGEGAAAANTVTLVPGETATATFTQENLAAITTADTNAYHAAASAELARVEEATGESYPQATAALDELDYTMAYVNFPTATTVSILDAEGAAPAAVEPGDTLYAKVENAPASAEVEIAWYTQSSAGELLELVGEGSSFTPAAAYSRLVAVISDATRTYLGTVVSSSLDVEEPLAFAVYSTDDNSVILYADSYIPEVGSTYDSRVVSELDDSIEVLDNLPTAMSSATLFSMKRKLTFPTEDM
jgi:hypothetical protein